VNVARAGIGATAGAESGGVEAINVSCQEPVNDGEVVDCAATGRLAVGISASAAHAIKNVCLIALAPSLLPIIN